MLKVAIIEFFVKHAIKGGVLIVPLSLRNFQKRYKGGPNKEFPPPKISKKWNVPPPINRSGRVGTHGAFITKIC